MEKPSQPPLKKDRNIVEILGIRLVSTSINSVLETILKRLGRNQKTLIFTPNPEFIVYGQQSPSFRQILNSADISLPDGIGLVLAGRILGHPLRGRIAGSELTEKLLDLAAKNHWRVGLVGARRGDIKQRQELIRRLQQRYPGARIYGLEDLPTWRAKDWEIIFACQGMGKQERWLKENLGSTKALVFMAVGGSLDFLAGFVPRAPECIRSIGFEWLYRLIRQPWRVRRQLALLKFVWLVGKEKIS